jgi:hypothetical protein
MDFEYFIIAELLEIYIIFANIIGAYRKFLSKYKN